MTIRIEKGNGFYIEGRSSEKARRYGLVHAFQIRRRTIY